MQPPMVGTWDVELHHVRPFTIHGDIYYEVHVIRTDDPANKMLSLRIPQHAIAPPPLPGQHWRLTFLMGQVTTAEKLP